MMKSQKPFNQIFHSIQNIERELERIKSMLPLHLAIKKSPKNLLIVTTPKNRRIAHTVQSDTLMESLEEMGFERVEPLTPEITTSLAVAHQFHAPRISKNGKYFVETSLSVSDKKKLLDKLAKSVPGDWKVEILLNK